MPLDKFGRSQITSSQSDVIMNFASDSESIDFEGKILKNIGESIESTDAVALGVVQKLIERKIQMLINDVASVQKTISKVENVDRYINDEFVKMKNLLRKENAQMSDVQTTKLYRTISDFIYDVKGELKNDIINLTKNLQVIEEKIKKLDESMSTNFYDLQSNLQAKLQKLHSTNELMKKEQKLITNEINYLKDHVHALLKEQESD